MRFNRAMTDGVSVNKSFFSMGLWVRRAMHCPSCRMIGLARTLHDRSPLGSRRQWLYHQHRVEYLPTHAGVCGWIVKSLLSTWQTLGAPKGCLRERHSHIRNSRHESDRDQMGRKPRGQRRHAFPDPVRDKGPQWETANSGVSFRRWRLIKTT